jgi:preprotein translocase subunit Sec63
MKKVAREECERLLKQRYKEYVDNPDPDKERPLKDEVRSEMLEIQNLTPNAFHECWQKLGLEKWKAPGAPRLKKT